MLELAQQDVAGRRVLVRLDLNLPMQGGKIQSLQRLESALPTIRHLREQGAHTLLMSHLGRPPEGQITPDKSLAPVAEALSLALDCQVVLVTDYLQHPPEVAAGETVLLENLRFNRGESADDAALAKQYAALCDVFVMDAFGSAHRAHASTHGVIEHAPMACAGPLLTREWHWISEFLERPNRPLVAILGGAKVSSKLPVLEALTDTVDTLLPGGGIANTFLAAAGFELGASLYEPELIPTAKRLLDKPDCDILLPVDVRVAGPDTADGTLRPADQIGADERVMDLGPDTLAKYAARLNTASTILWNGPLGVFEQPAFAAGTEALAQAVAASSATSLAGGGETIAAIEQTGVHADINHISTGGGAFLAALAREPLPAIVALGRRG